MESLPPEIFLLILEHLPVSSYFSVMYVIATQLYQLVKPQLSRIESQISANLRIFGSIVSHYLPHVNDRRLEAGEVSLSKLRTSVENDHVDYDYYHQYLELTPDDHQIIDSSQNLSKDQMVDLISRLRKTRLESHLLNTILGVRIYLCQC